MNTKIFTPIEDKDFIYKKLNSKFYSFVFGVSSNNEVRKHLNELKKKYSNASHICYAYRLFDGFTLLDDINISEYSNDAGEPRGSAGPPILKILKRQKVINAVIFVVRYFGGKKLGIPGLIEAYSESSKGLINKDTLKLWFPVRNIVLEYPYNIENSLNILFKNFDVVIKKQEFKTSILSIIELNQFHFDNFTNELSNFPSCTMKKTKI
mgnify:CR=1 FL=1